MYVYERKCSLSIFLASSADLTKNTLRYNYTIYFTIWPVYRVATHF